MKRFLLFCGLFLLVPVVLADSIGRGELTLEIEGDTIDNVGPFGFTTTKNDVFIVRIYEENWEDEGTIELLMMEDRVVLGNITLFRVKPNRMAPILKFLVDDQMVSFLPSLTGAYSVGDLDPLGLDWMDEFPPNIDVELFTDFVAQLNVEDYKQVCDQTRVKILEELVVLLSPGDLEERNVAVYNLIALIREHNDCLVW